ncbi:MAG: RNA-binding protein [Candidatus Zixiibacteriota bacterium]
MNIYIGNLTYDTSEDQIRQAFEAYGTVSTVSIVTDKYTGESRGFGFVEMATKDEALTAINELNGRDMNGRNLNVSEAKPRPQNNNRGGGNNRGYRKSY